MNLRIEQRAAAESGLLQSVRPPAGQSRIALTQDFCRAMRFLAAAVCALLSCPCPPARAAHPQVKEVVVVFKTHFDIGYTALVTNVLERYRTTFVDGAIKLIEDSRSRPTDQRFVWTVPGWPLDQMLWPGQTPARRQAILQALKDGQLALHALPFTTHTESLELEDLT